MIVGVGLDAVFGFAVGLIAVYDFLAGPGGAFLGVVVALRVTLHCKHQMSRCIVQTSSSLSSASGETPRRSHGSPWLGSIIFSPRLPTLLEGELLFSRITFGMPQEVRRVVDDGPSAL